jgi:hypothetical protein
LACQAKVAFEGCRHEKRAHSRIVVRIAVTCTTDGGASLAGATHDISTGGVFIEGTEIPAFGTRVSLEFDAPELAGLKIPGIVRWTKAAGFGVQFQLLGARETHALALIVSRSARS